MNRNCSSRTPRGPKVSKIICEFEDVAYCPSLFPIGGGYLDSFFELGDVHVIGYVTVRGPLLSLLDSSSQPFIYIFHQPSQWSDISSMEYSCS